MQNPDPIVDPAAKKRADNLRFGALMLGALVVMGIGAAMIVHFQRDAGFIDGADGGQSCPVHWPPELFPIPVKLDRTSVLETVVRQEIDVWNVAVGHEVLVFAGLTDDVDAELDPVITLAPDFTLRDHARSHPQWFEDCELGRIDTRYIGDLPAEWMQHREIEHELGHALGLGHATDPTSVMYPELVEHAPWFVKPHDAELLRTGL